MRLCALANKQAPQQAGDLGLCARFARAQKHSESDDKPGWGRPWSARRLVHVKCSNMTQEGFEPPTF